MGMRTLNAARRIILLLLLIPVVFIFLNAVLRSLGAQQRNPIVSSVRRGAEFFIIEPFRTVFGQQSYVQDAVVSLVCFGVLALVIVAVFKGLQSAASARPPRTSAPLPRARAQSAPPPATSTPPPTAADKPVSSPADPPAATKSDDATA